jgi:hypothetical protein
MAKKAGGDTTTTWILLVEARTLVIRAYEAEKLAESLLVKWLGEGRVRWSCKLLDGPRESDLATRQREADGGGLWFFEAYAAYSEGDPAFWRTGLDINWQEGWAREMYEVGGTTAYGIRVVREDVLELLPPSDVAGDRASARKKRKAPQVDRILAALQPGALFPDGVPPDMTTNVALPKVVKYLQPETEMLGLSAPEWDSVDRALKQYRAK